MDFLAFHSITVDCGARTIIDKLISKEVGLKPYNGRFPPSFHVNNFSSCHPQAKHLLDAFPELTSPRNHGRINSSMPQHAKTFHRIETRDSPPTYAKTRRLTGEKLEAAKEQFKQLLQSGIIRPSSSPWSSPLHLVPKKETGSYRICGDFRSLNSVTKPDRYPLPNIRSMSDRLHNKAVFSKIDLFRAYHQIPVHPEDIEKTAVTTPFGLYEYVYMPFGLRNAGSTFQRFMDSIFRNIDCVFIYMDDLLIFSENEEQHSKDLKQVLEILSKNDLRISTEKCTFFRNEVEFLGFNLSSKGLAPSETHRKKITDLQLPQDSNGLRRFLGMVNFYRHLIPNFAQMALPLTNLIRDNPKAKNLVHDDSTRSAFDILVKSLNEAQPLSFPDPKSDIFQLVTDASQEAVGAALHQMIDSKPVPIAFFSKKLTSSQKVYSTFDRELLAVYSAVLHFKDLIESRQVTLFTDHKPLVSAFYSKNPAKSDRQQRHLSVITEYLSEAKFIRGADNVVADYFSRTEFSINNCFEDIPTDLEAIENAQRDEAEMNEYSHLKDFPLGNNRTIKCDCSSPFPRPFIPNRLRIPIIDKLHKLSHPGVKGTLSLVKPRYYWPGMDKQIRDVVKSCVKCQQSKIGRHTKSEIQTIDYPSERFEYVHIDLVGPLPPATIPENNSTFTYKYLLTCIDRQTRWVEAIPLAGITAKEVAFAFFTGWISRFATPLYVVTDRGAQFQAELFKELSSLIGFHRIRTSSYHPQSNGLIERTHRTIKSAIIARKENWLLALPSVLLGIRCIPNASGVSPFFAVTGKMPLQPRYLFENVQNKSSKENTEFLAKFAKAMKELDYKTFPQTYEKPQNFFVPHELTNCPSVWLRVDRVKRPLEAPYTGPFKVIQRHSKFFKIELPTGNHDTVSIDRLKPAFLNASDYECKKTKRKISSNSESRVNIDDGPIVNNKEVITSKSGRIVTFKKDNDFFYF